MKSLLATISLLTAVLSPINASAVIIDFESFNDRDNINGMNLGGVTLTSPGNRGTIEVYDNRFGLSSNSPTKSIANFPNDTNSPKNATLIGTFDQAVSYISLWAGDIGGITGDLDSWSLSLFDAKTGGNLIASLLAPVWNGSPYSQLELASNNILRFEAAWTGPGCCGIGYDDLKFDFAVAAPAPITAALFGLGLLVILGGRQFRRQ